MCLAGTVVAFWSLIQELAGSSPFTVMTNIFSLNLLNSVKTFRENSNILGTCNWWVPLHNRWGKSICLKSNTIIVRVPRVRPPLHRGPLGFQLFSEVGRRNIICSVICPLHHQSTWFVLTNRSEASHCREVYEDGKFFLFQIFWISAKSTVSGASFAKPFSYS